MNAPNQNHDPAQSDDLPDRLVDLALSELVGGNTPPDLSSQIAAATFREPAAVAQVPKARPSRAFWVNLAVAVMLLIGVTIVLLPQMHSVRERSRTIAKESAKQNRKGAPQLTEMSSMQQLSQASAKPAQPIASASQQHGTSAQHSLQSRAGAEGFGPGDASQPRSSNLSLGISQSQVVASAAPASADALAAAPSPPRESLEFHNANPSGTPQAHPANRQDDLYALRGVPPAKGNPRPTDLPAIQIEKSYEESLGVAVTSPADNGTLAESAVPGFTSNAIASTAKGTGPKSSDDKYGRGTTPTPTTTQLLDEIRELQRQGKPTEKRLKELQRRVEKSVDLSAQSAEGSGPDSSGDKYTRIVENPFVKAEGGAAVSTLSIDVDTASYANVRQFLLQMNQLPPPDAVRIEELINYFQYNYEAPKQSDEAPFAAHVEVTSCPWAPEHRLARIGIKGREMDRNKRPQSNLVFLVDVSGSMNEPAKLPLVVYGLEQLTRELGENDHIAIVVYAGTEGLVLPSTSGSKQDTILAALAKLQAGGSTAGGAGIQLAYQIAEDNFIKGGTNRVILCTDGDFNVGVTNTADLQRLVEQKAKDTGVFLSTLGFGRGNLNDAMMVAISDHGNGNYHYIDNRTEARRVLVEGMTGTLVTIAKDVKIQVEFNPAQVAGYRLIGYEKRMLRTEDFNDDKKDAGEIGAGHTVTALYEIVPAGKKTDIAPVDDLKYQTAVSNSDEYKKLTGATNKELLTLKMRYKAPDGDTSKKLEWPVTDDGKAFAAASGDLKFAASVAGFGLLLRNSQYKGNLTYAATLELAQGGIGEDPHGYRKEFLDMVRKAKELRHE